MISLFTKIPKFHPHQEIKTIGIIVGHTSKSPGAVVIPSGSGKKTYEYFYNLEVANQLLKRRACDTVVTRDYKGISGATSEIIKSGVDLSIELHCNAANTRAHGVEALYYNSPSQTFATYFCDQLAARFSRRNRGAKYVVTNGRGVSNLQLLADIPYAIIGEPFFGDNVNDYIPQLDYTNFLSELLAKVKVSSQHWSKNA